MYDGHLLDMVEFGVTNYIEMNDIEGHKKMIGSKPLLVFQGDQWETDTIYARLQNLFLDFFPMILSKFCFSICKRPILSPIFVLLMFFTFFCFRLQFDKDMEMHNNSLMSKLSIMYGCRLTPWASSMPPSTGRRRRIDVF